MNQIGTIIYETLAGSQLYGTALPTSDTDYRGVCLQPWWSLLGLNGFEQQETKDPDRCIYGSNKFLSLASQCNPNIIEILFAPISGPTLITHHPAWAVILANRDAFISRAARAKFSGYAYQQAHRMKTHYNWLNGNPPKDVKPEDYGGVPKDGGGGISWPNAMMQNEYANAHHQWNQYQTWLKERNEKRHELEVKYGYDTKYGMHLIRLIQEGLELLRTGFITLPRPNAKELLDIRHGAMTYQDMMNFFEVGILEVEDAEKTSTLPWGADTKRIEDLAVELNTISLYYARDEVDQVLKRNRGIQQSDKE